jgi:hypothetical protein
MGCPKSRSCYWCGWKGHAPSFCHKNPNVHRGAAEPLDEAFQVKTDGHAGAGAGPGPMARDDNKTKKRERSQGEEDDNNNNNNNRRVKDAPKEHRQMEEQDEEEEEEFEILINTAPSEPKGSKVPEEDVEEDEG